MNKITQNPQWKAGTTDNSITNRNSGNVGIGTTGPGAALHVNAAAITGAEIVSKFQVSDDASEYLAIRNNSVGGSVFVPEMVGYYNGSTQPALTLTGDSGSGDTGTVPLVQFNATKAGSALTTRPLFSFNNNGTAQVLIDKSGNVGIGTTAPTVKLDVNISARTTAYSAADQTTWSDAHLWNPTITLSAATGIAFELGTTYHANSAGGIAVVKSVGASDNGADMVFITRPQSAVSAERMRIDSTGNVGIGTTSPTNLLSLGGGSARTLWMERHTTANTAGNNLLVQAGGATAAATDKNGGLLVLAPGLSTGIGTNSVVVQTSPVGTTGTADNALATRVTVDSTEINLNWGLKIRRTATATDYTVLVTDYYIGVTSTAAARVITLPAAATAGAGKTYVVKDESGGAGTNNITIDGNALETIDGSTTITLNANYESVTLVCDSVGWYII